MKYHIEDKDWEIIYENLRKIPGLHSKNQGKVRLFCEAIWYICRSGCQWRLLPDHYGHWRALHRRFLRWARRGIWGNLLESAKVDPDLEAVMIDAISLNVSSEKSIFSGVYSLGSTRLHVLIWACTKKLNPYLQIG